jgi:hypothetical protein
VSVHAIVWIVTGVLLVIVLALAGVQVMRGVREGMRAKARVDAYGSLQVVAALREAETNAHRLEAALAQIDPLIARAQAALAVIRRGPFPLEVVGAYVRVRDEVAAFRRVRRGP